MSKNVDSETKGTPNSARAQARRERVRFAGPRLRLQIDESLLDPSYVYRFFNDHNDELGQAQRAGYVFVTKDEINDPEVLGDKEVHGGNTDLNSMVSRIVGRNRAGGELRGYLMKIERQLYEEDQRWREKEVNARVDESIMRGIPGRASPVENAYGLRVEMKKGS